MAIRYYISTEEASFFINNRMGYANSIPTSGNYKVGDFIISSTQEDGIFGWVCTVAGTPGEWEVIGSGMSNGSVMHDKVVGYINAVSFSDTRSSIEIGINEYEKGKDFLEVHYNGLMLAEGVHYNVSEDGKSIIALDEVWNENADDTQQMIFRVIKSEGVNVKELKNTININSACYEVEMGIEGFSPEKDVVEVHLNGVLLVQGVDYEIVEGRISKLDRNEAWNPYNVNGQKMFVRVFRNIANLVEPVDGSVTMEKLSPDVRSDVAAIDGLVSSLGIQNSTISNLNDRVTAIEEKIESGDIVTNGGGGGGGPVKLTYKDNLVEVINTNTVAIGLPFNKEKDMLEVHIDGLKLAEGVHYNISEDGTSIVKVEGVWNPDSLEDQYIDFRVITAGNQQIDHLTRNVEFSSPMTEVGIELEYEHGVDILIVHLNGIKLVEGLDFEYVAEGNKIVKIDGNEPWNLYGVDGQLFVIDVLRNVGEKVEMDDLADDVKQAIEAAGNIDLSGFATKEELNVLFQDVDNGKNLIATSIGNPLITGNSTFKAMSEAILGLRRNTENETDAKEVLYNMMIEDGYNEATSSMTVDELIDLLDDSNIKLNEIAQVACGYGHAFILKNDGSLWACGNNSTGQLGLNNKTDSTTFKQVTTNINNDVKQVACGDNFTIILKNDGSVWGSGYNGFRSLGLGDNVDRTTFTQVTTNVNNDVKQIACGHRHTMIIKNDGSLWGCGYNNNGELGLNNVSQKDTFTKVTTNVNNDVKFVTCGMNYTFIIKNDGSLWGCGYNSDGQLGLGTYDSDAHTTFTQVTTNINNDVAEIACGNGHSIIIKNDGSVWGCGRNDYGQVGLNNTTTRITTFTQATTNINNDAKQVSCGWYHTMVLKNDGSVWTCGWNTHGQLGLSNNDDKSVLTKASDNCIKATCGSYYIFMVKNDNSVWSSGDSYAGQLGLGDKDRRNEFTQVQIPSSPIDEYEISRLKLYYYLLDNEIPVTEDMNVSNMLDLLVDEYVNNMILGYENNLRIILTDEGVEVTEEDDMANLITKVDEEFDRKNNQEYQFDANQEGYPVDILTYTDKIVSSSTTWAIFKQETLPLSGIFKCETGFTKLGTKASPASVRLGVVDTNGVETFYDTFSQSSTNGTTIANWIIDIQRDSTINFYGMVESAANTLSIHRVSISTNVVCN